MDDPELLRAYVENRSEPAFAALVDRYTKLVYSAALRQVGGNIHLARDVVQSVFTDLARKAGSLRHRKVLTGWLYTSTHLAVVETFRAEMRRRAREQEAQIMMQISSGDTPDTWSRLRPVLDEAMRELSDCDRDSILLRYFEGRPFAEIGEKLSLTENAARMRVERALDRMHALLSKRGLTSSTAALATVLAEQAVGAVPPGLVADVASAALVQAASAAKPLFHFLGLAKAQIVTIATVTVVCAGALTILAQSNQRLRSEASQLGSKNREMALSLRDSRRQLETRTEGLTAWRQLATGVSQQPFTIADSTPTPSDRRLMLRTRTSVALFYAGLFRSLKLSADKQERLEKLLLQKSLQEIPVLHALSYGLIDSAAASDLDVIAAFKAAAAGDIVGQIHTLLGDAFFSRYDDYARTLPVRRQVEDIAAALRSTSDALRADQIDELVAFVARGGADYTRPLPESLLKEARVSLDANQQSALNRLQAIRLARRTILEANREAAAKGLVHLPPPWGLELDAL
jgi:RNA polymerase sigma factor (sigma-70 family)